MKIRKITEGVVIQVFDTETKEYVSQEFKAEDWVGYENEAGEPIDSEEMESEDGSEPYLPFDMVQPKDMVDEDSGPNRCEVNLKEPNLEPENNGENLLGDCRNEALVTLLFGSVTDFAQRVEEFGEQFSWQGVDVTYDRDQDVHYFWRVDVKKFS